MISNDDSTNRVSLTLARVSGRPDARISKLSEEFASLQNYTNALEQLLNEHGIPLPKEHHPSDGLTHVLHYQEGLWPTKYEIVNHAEQQHLVVGKRFSCLSASIVNRRGETVNPHTIEAFGGVARFRFVLLCKPGNSDTFEHLRVPTTGVPIPLSQMIIFEHGTPIDIETGIFTVSESHWSLRFRLTVSSGCARRAPKLFKIRIEPIFNTTDSRTRQTDSASDNLLALTSQMTIETTQFRSVLRNYDSKALKAYRASNHSEYSQSESMSTASSRPDSISNHSTKSSSSSNKRTFENSCDGSDDEDEPIGAS